MKHDDSILERSEYFVPRHGFFNLYNIASSILHPSPHCSSPVSAPKPPPTLYLLFHHPSRLHSHTSATLDFPPHHLPPNIFAILTSHSSDHSRHPIIIVTHRDWDIQALSSQKAHDRSIHLVGCTFFSVIRTHNERPALKIDVAVHAHLNLILGVSIVRVHYGSGGVRLGRIDGRLNGWSKR